MCRIIFIIVKVEAYTISPFVGSIVGTLGRNACNFCLGRTGTSKGTSSTPTEAERSVFGLCRQLLH